MKYLYAFFSPLRDPFYKDWLFYLFLFFEIPQTIRSIEVGGGEGLFSFVAGTVINWALFVVGGAKLRAPGLPLIFGIASSKKTSASKNRNFASEQENSVEIRDLAKNRAKYGAKGEEYLLKSFQGGSKRLETYVDATIILAAFKGDGLPTLNAKLFGPVWFKCPDLRREYPASFCLTENNLLFFSWRKRPNALLDFWVTPVQEIKRLNIGGTRMSVSTARRTIGSVSGIVQSEDVQFSPRLESDRSVNEIALIGYFALSMHLEKHLQ